MPGRPRKREPPSTPEAWDALHKEQFKTQEAAAFYTALVGDLEAAGHLNAATRSLARDAAAQEDIIIAAMKDIRTNGAVEKIEQGSQKLRVENRYLKAKHKAEVRKQDILEALGMLPGKKSPGRPAKEKDEDETPEDDPDKEWEAF